MNTAIDLSFLPIEDSRREELSQALGMVQQALGDNLVSLILFGSAVTGEYNPERSDLNLMLVLSKDDRAALKSLHAPLRKLILSFKVSPMLITIEEVATSSDVFPVKFGNICENHRLLAGKDVFNGLTIQQDHMRLRCEQELKNMSLRLRRMLATRAATAVVQKETILNLLPAFTIACATLLKLHGQEVPADKAALLQAAAQTFELSATAMKQLASLRLGKAEPEVIDLDELTFCFLEVVTRAAQVADRLELS